MLCRADFHADKVGQLTSPVKVPAIVCVVVVLHYKCLHITKWWNSADRRYRENCSCARVLVFVLIRIMCCWVELGFSPNSPQTHTVISADFRARPCSAQCVLIFLVFFNQEGDFSFYFASSTAQISRHDLWRQKCGPFVVIVRDWFFFLGVLESLFFFRPNLFKFKPNWRHSFGCRGKLSALLCWRTHSKAA